MDVYEPSDDSQLIKAQIKEYAKGRVLDIGTGSGILAEEAASYAREVIAIDNNQKAIDYCSRTCPNKAIKFVKSDLFEHVSGKFNLIICNPPYLPKDKGIEDPALYGGKHGYEYIERLLRKVADYMEDDGVLLLLFSSLTNRAKVLELISEALLEGKEIAKKSFMMEQLYVYAIVKSERLKGLHGRGVTSVFYFAQGNRGIVYKGMIGKTQVGIKVKKPTSSAIDRMVNEAYWLPRVNEIGIGPKYIFHSEDMVVYEFVEGVYMKDWLPQASSETTKAMLLELLLQARKLDKLGVDKAEMLRPFKNLIIGKKPVFIDFERMRRVLQPKNVTQFCQYLTSNHSLDLLLDKGISIDSEALRSAAAAYKSDQSDENFKRLLSTTNFK